MRDFVWKQKVLKQQKTNQQTKWVAHRVSLRRRRSREIEGSRKSWEEISPKTRKSLSFFFSELENQGKARSLNRFKIIGSMFKRKMCLNSKVIRIGFLLLMPNRFCYFYFIKLLFSLWFQMKLLHPVNNRKVVGFSETERLEAKNAIYKNVIDSIVQVLQFSLYFKGKLVSISTNLQLQSQISKML